jgi:asparagine synthase (glutamine-hydrolysing)
MNGLTGIYKRNGETVPKPEIEQMLAQLSHRSRNGSSNRCAGQIAFGYANISQAPPRFYENIYVSFHGVLINEEELQQSVNTRNSDSNYSCENLIASLYRQYGCEFFSRLEGDFAFTIWDATKERLVCCRDIIGIKPFYYFFNNSLFLWASEMKGIVKHPAVPTAPNEFMVGEYLADRITSKTETLYKHIFRLPPAHYMVVTKTGITQKRYWHPQVKPLQYRNDDDYADHLAELMTSTVAAYTRGHNTVGIQLSGGVDSSTLHGFTSSLTKNEATTPSAVQAFSLVFPGMACDESHFIDDVLNKWPSESYRHTPVAQTIRSCSKQAELYAHIPDYPNGAMSNELLKETDRRGIHLLLTGQGGDEWFQGTPFHFAEYLSKLQLLKFVRQAKHLPNKALFGLNKNSLPYLSLAPLLPKWLKGIVPNSRQPATYPSWLSKELLKELGTKHPLPDQQKYPGSLEKVQEILFQKATNGFQVHALEMEERSSAFHNIDQRHPFYAKPIIEFALSLPLDQLCRGSRDKFILRNAARSHLPPSVYSRNTKARFEHVFAQSIFGCKEILKGHLALVEAGWVSGTSIREYVINLENNYYINNNYCFSKALWAVWSFLAMEFWYRSK